MEDVALDELTLLKAQADRLGVRYNERVSLDKLKARVAAAIEGTPVESDEEAVEAPVATKVETKGQKRVRQRREASRLIRVNIQSMNPEKKDWKGEIVSVGNSHIGMFRKYVPYNGETTDGYHIPVIIYNYMKNRMCQIWVNSKLKNGEVVRVPKMVKEFAIEVLPPLTKEELAELAAAQAARGSIDG